MVLLLVGAAIAAVAWQVGRQAEREAMRESAAAARPAEVASAPPADASAPVAEPAPAEAEAIYEVPVADLEEPAAVPDAPTAAPDWPPPAERRVDTPARCIQLTAQPSNVSAFGSSGEVVQLVVRAQNGCGTNFDSAWFRAVALAPDGRELASASGRFPGGVRAGSSAETLIALRTKPAPSLTYRAEIQ